jgi:hypothetical protein
MSIRILESVSRTGVAIYLVSWLIEVDILGNLVDINVG